MDDALLVQKLRAGDVDAGYRFVRDCYPSVYRYLLYLTGRPETAEDLTQETFLQAWRRLDTFDEGAPLRPWLHRIAHRQFLQALRRQRPQSFLEELPELPAPGATETTEAVELRMVIGTLPLEEREVVLLHDVEGYSSAEIAEIVGAPAGTVRYRLSRARERLRGQLGEGDLPYLNEPSFPMRQWHWLPLDRMHALEADLTLAGEARKEDPMERREFLRQAAAGAAGLMLTEPEKEIVDSRLAQKVTLAVKATALSDLCEQMRTETGVHLSAGASVAEEKVTLFCKAAPLRDVIRQLSRPFGYAWSRSGTAGDFRYELLQDLRSQLLEEELRNRDRHAALLALDREIERYRPYVVFSPEEALARAETAPPAEKTLLKRLANEAWGPVQVYFRLSSEEQAALRAGRTVTYSGRPQPGESPLPAAVARGMLQALPLRDWRVFPLPDGFGATTNKNDPEGLLPSAVPEVFPAVTLSLQQSELGRFTLQGASSLRSPADRPRDFSISAGDIPLAVGTSAPSLGSESRSPAPPRVAGADLRRRVTVEPRASCDHPGHRARGDDGRVTSADVIEALHQATGLNLVADYYTRLYPATQVSVRELPLSDALNRLAKVMHVRWNQDPETGWLQFRSATYYHDRVKEVPNRLLSRWAAARRRQGTLSLDHLIEIAALPDAQLDAEEMAEGARECLGLAEWDLACRKNLRPHLRFLAQLPPELRTLAQSPTGLPFTRMPLAQQQQFLALALGKDAQPIQLEELAGAALWVGYTHPGGFQWAPPPGPTYRNWVAQVEPGREGRRALRPPVVAPTREAALTAARRLEPETDLTQFVASELGLTFVYLPGTSNRRPIRVHLWTPTNRGDLALGTW